MTAQAVATQFLEARLRMRTVAEGGRSCPIQEQYMPNWWVPDPDEAGGRALVSGAVEIVEGDELVPGEEGSVRIYPFAPDLWRHVRVGTTIEMTEGPSFVVASAKVTEVRL
jgi:hypothetical protein